jgi:superfamily II DNA or RNA helicase
MEGMIPLIPLIPLGKMKVLKSQNNNNSSDKMADSLDLLIQQQIIDENKFPIQPTGWMWKPSAAVIFQDFTKLGYPYQVVISWIQKAVRRGRMEEALFCAAQLVDMGGIFLSNLVNRLVVMVSEDVGVAEPLFPIRALKLYHSICELRTNDVEKRKENDRLPEVRQKVAEFVSELVRAHKCRYADDVYCYSRILAEQMDVEKTPLRNSISKFRDAIKNRKARRAIMWAGIVHRNASDCNIAQSEFGLSVLSHKTHSSHLVWDYLFSKLNAEESKEQKQLEDVLNALYSFYCERGGNEGILHLTHAINLFVRVMKNEIDIVNARPIVKEKRSLANRMRSILEEKLPIPSFAFDGHSREGKMLGRGKHWFWKHSCKLHNSRCVSECAKIVKRMLDYSKAMEQDPAMAEDRKERIPRKYQEKIVNKAVKKLVKKRVLEDGRKIKALNSIHLNMSCGSGKTLSSLWIVRKIPNVRVVSVFVPSLILLDNFVSEWRREFLAMRGIRVACVVIGSSSVKWQQNDDFMWIRSMDREEINRWINWWEEDKRIDYVLIFSSYQSSAKLDNSLMVADVGIMDESHLMNYKGKMRFRKIIYSSATQDSNISGFSEINYSLGNAIKDGSLCDYRIHFKSIPEFGFYSEFANFCSQWQMAGCSHSLCFSPSINCSKNIMESKYMKGVIKGENKVFCSDMSVKERHNSIESFRKNGGMLYSSWMLSTGVDIPECNGIVIVFKKMKESRLVQVIGRALRLCKGKNIARVAIICLPENEDDMVRDVAKKMKRHDSKVKEKISEWGEEWDIMKKTVRKEVEKVMIPDLANIVWEYVFGIKEK